MDDRYRARRAEFEASFGDCEPQEETRRTVRSPSRRYELTTVRYVGEPPASDFSRGTVVDVASGAEIADVHRNHGAFWHAWVEHPDGSEYLLCGEDYQGYSVVDLTHRRTHVHFPDEGHQGAGFCWSAVFPSPDGRMLAVEGCHWAGPYELVFYDFREPGTLPLCELRRIEGGWDVAVWAPDGRVHLTRDIDVRASDGAPLESLPDEEQARLLAGAQELLAKATETMVVAAPGFEP